MKTPAMLFAAVLAASLPAPAQDDIPLLRPEEREAVDAQTDAFNTAIQPVLSDAAKSTVRIWSGQRRLAYGTIIRDGTRVLTKWSEAARANKGLVVQASGGETRSATLTGVYEDEDLAVLEIAGAPLTPVRWQNTPPALGAFLAAPQPDGRPAAFGVVSVAERNLRETDQAFLGVVGDAEFDGPGVRIRELAPESGAKAAGLRPGDVILKVGERAISGLLELKNSLVGTSPGSKITVLARTNDGEKAFDVLLGNRPSLPQFPGDRLRAMERMGGPISRVRDSFSSAIQTDMRPRPDQIGGPVVNLQGEVIGITLARADRTRSFVMPASAVAALLAKPAKDPSLAKVRQPDLQASTPNRRQLFQPQVMPRSTEEQLRRHLTEMQRLMDVMREEMEALEQGAESR